MKQLPSLFQTLILLVLLAGPSALAGTRRYAVVVGHNTGGPGRLPLRYAESDAGKMARLLHELGEVAAGDLYLLQGRGPAEVEKTLIGLRASVLRAHQALDRVVIYFYFSGHGDSSGLELGPQRLSHPQLRELLEATGAELRVSFIDACRSGAAVQEKGAHEIPAFDVRLEDELGTRGHAVVASSARDELSLESSELGGGIFTSHLVTGLRGAADVSGDGQVTLSEIYRYTYDRTVTTTALSAGSSQHPSFELSLSGQGELVLSRLERSSARLILPGGVQRALVWDLISDQLVAEWVGGAASSSMAVSPGSYKLAVVAEGQSLGGRMRLAVGEQRQVRMEELRPMERVAVVEARGASSAPSLGPPPRSERVELSLLGAGGEGLGGLVRLGLEARSGHGITAGLMFGTHRVMEPMDFKNYQGNFHHTFTLMGRGGYRWLWAFERYGAWVGGEVAAGVVMKAGSTRMQPRNDLWPVLGIGPRAGFYYEPHPDWRWGVVAESLVGSPVLQLGIGFNVSWLR